jgi:cytochrome P450 monooxygenase
LTNYAAHSTQSSQTAKVQNKTQQPTPKGIKILSKTAQPDKWVQINPNELFIRLIALATSRVMAGDVLRDNEQWLELASSYTTNVGLTVILLRPFPAWIRPLVALFLPPVRQMKKQLRFAKDLFVPMVHERRQAVPANDPAYSTPDDFLQWMIELGEEKGETLDPEILAHHMLLLVTLAVVHTSSMALYHTLHDLISMPEYLEPLHEEMKRTLSDGWYKGTKAALAEQHRLDSFMRESQRFDPPGECESLLLQVYGRF